MSDAHVCLGDARLVQELRVLLPETITLEALPNEGSPSPETTIYVSGRPTRGQVEACPNLRMLVIPYAGVPEATRLLMLEHPQVAVHNLHHNAAAASEMAMALFLAAAKQVVTADRLLRQGDWSIRYSDAGDMQLVGKRGVILGYGEIGRRIARACAGLGMTPIGVCRQRRGSHAAEGFEVHPVDRLDALLPSADALFVALPLTVETQGMIGFERLSLLPKHSVVVNIARGLVIQEEALYDALSTGTLSAAGIDVWYQYPDAEGKTSTFPSAFPFHELGNVVMSPHRGGAYNRPELERARVDHLARLLNAAARGEPVPNRVDLEAGY